jgi:hypothetical protein
MVTSSLSTGHLCPPLPHQERFPGTDFSWRLSLSLSLGRSATEMIMSIGNSSDTNGNRIEPQPIAPSGETHSATLPSGILI